VLDKLRQLFLGHLQVRLGGAQLILTGERQRFVAKIE
jgi:hypothetical protein